MAKKSNAVVRKKRHKVRTVKHQPERNGAKVIKANHNRSVSHKKGSKELSHDVVKLGNLLHMAAAKEVKDLAMNLL